MVFTDKKESDKFHTRVNPRDRSLDNFNGTFHGSVEEAKSSGFARPDLQKFKSDPPPVRGMQKPPSRG